MTELEAALRRIVREELRAVLAETSAASSAPACEWLTVSEAAELARVSTKTVRNWIAGGELERHGVGRHARVARAELARRMATGPKPKSAEHTPEQLAVLHLRRQAG